MRVSESKVVGFRIGGTAIEFDGAQSNIRAMGEIEVILKRGYRRRLEDSRKEAVWS